ncbi:MAG: hypothetical protein HQ581_01800 [Planctomycetes bacterium]|nr:hypothetical protein [Planctomycetota bacterium]
MKGLQATLVVFRFELQRTLTPARLAYGAGLALFPALVTLLMRTAGGGQLDAEMILFVLIPEVVCVLGLLLWAAPAVHAELEGRTWIYLAVRPGGRTAVLWGKYLTAVAWTAVTAWIGLTLALLVLQPSDAGRLWGVMAVLVLLSCLTYGALYSLLGTIFLKRAMSICVFHALVLELVVGLIPAVINQFTVQYHLRCLLAIWIRWKKSPGEMQSWYGSAPAWQHVALLLAAVMVLMAIAGVILRYRELIRSEDA